MSIQPTRAVIVELYCQSQKLTIPDFLITPSAAHKDTIESIRVRFKREFNVDLEGVYPHDINGEPIRTSEDGEVIDGVAIDGDPIYNFRNVQHGERIIVLVSRDELFLPEIKHEIVLYLGDVMGQDIFKTMSRQDRRHRIRMMRRMEAVQRKNIIRLTAPHTDIAAELEKDSYSVSLSSRIIQDNWKIAQMYPVDRGCLSALAILSQATCGQPWVAEYLLQAEKFTRETGESRLLEEDVRTLIEELYSDGNAIGSTWDLSKPSAHDTIMSYLTEPGGSFS